MAGTGLGEVAAACRAAVLAELVVPGGGPGQAPAVTSVVPLGAGERPVLALPYASAPIADDIAAAGEMTLVLSDPRRAGDAWRPMVARLRAEVGPDPEGERFESDGLLEQELVKHPPSRLLADSPLLRREHWWYVPRLIVAGTGVLDVAEAAPRDDDDRAVLAWRGPPWPNADVVEVERWDAEGLRLASPSGRELGGLRGPGTINVHRASEPNLERQATFTATGELRGGWLDVEERRGSRELPRFRLRTGWRATRRLERACRRELSARS